MEQLSNSAFWAALIATAVAVFFYWGYAFGLRVVLRRLATNGGGFTVATFERLPDSFGRLGTAATWTAAAFLAISLFARWRATGYAPWSNMWEFTIAFAGGILLCQIIFERWLAGQGRRRSARTLGAVLQPVVVAMMAAAVVFFPSDVEPLVPALQSRGILAAHVGTMVLAYSALSVSFAAAVVYVIQGGGRNRFSRLPKAALLEEIAAKSVMAGFPLLTLGIVLGAYWGNLAWGRYWDWDPKETSALVSWLVYGAYLHARGLRGWSGARSAALLVVGYLSVLFSYFVVNLWLAGLHSYAGV